MRFVSLKKSLHSATLSYEAVRQFQLGLVESRSRDEIEDTILFLEHEPVITRGRGLQFTGAPREKHMPVPTALPPGIAFAESERGGDLTYHGPGQLVIYPIIKLDGSNSFAPKHDVARFLRGLEAVMMGVLGSYGLQADARPNATGVWIGDRKIASVGIAIRKWVTYHGIAINCVNDLQPFHLISPCGFAPEVMTRLQDCVPNYSAMEWRKDFETRWIRELSLAAELREGEGHSSSQILGEPTGLSAHEVGSDHSHL